MPTLLNPQVLILLDGSPRVLPVATLACSFSSVCHLPTLFSSVLNLTPFSRGGCLRIINLQGVVTSDHRCHIIILQLSTPLRQPRSESQPHISHVSSGQGRLTLWYSVVSVSHQTLQNVIISAVINKVHKAGMQQNGDHLISLIEPRWTLMSGLFSQFWGLNLKDFSLVWPTTCNISQLLIKDDKNHVQKSAALSLVSECVDPFFPASVLFRSDHRVFICVARERRLGDLLSRCENAKQRCNAPQLKACIKHLLSVRRVCVPLTRRHL